MTIHAWRVVKCKYKTVAFDGEGARKFGGRWNSRGVGIVYTSSSLALALLELLVHLKSSDLLVAYSAVPLSFPEELLEEIDPPHLPADWQVSPIPPAIQQLGDDWVHQGRSAVLRVPSVILPIEPNYLLNPAHPRFTEITLGTAIDMPIDPRLLATGA